MTDPEFAPRYPVVAGADFTTASFGQTPSQTVGPYTCTSASNGMSCVVDETGEGFRVATAALTTYCDGDAADVTEVTVGERFPARLRITVR